MKKIVIMAAMLLVSLPFAYSQDSTKVTVKPYGFIRNYYTFDSRKTYTVVGGEYNMIPYDEAWNEDHSEDLNAVPQGQLQALTSRFGVAPAVSWKATSAVLVPIIPCYASVWLMSN